MTINNSDKKFVLGVSAYFHDSAAVLVHGDEIIAAVQEERFSRIKADWRFPHKSIEYCINKLPRTIKLDAVAYYENPALKTNRILSNVINNTPRGAVLWKQTLKTLSVLNKDLPEELLKICTNPDDVYFLGHHRSHAASAYHPSSFNDAAILVVDGVGEHSTTTIWKGSDNLISPLKEIKFPHSLGLLYSAFTQYCGFKVNSGEYKLMGLAPFGAPIYKDLIYKNLITVKDDGSFALNLDYFSFEFDTSTICPSFAHLFGYPARLESQNLSTHYMNIAASIQAVLNEVMAKLVDTALKITQSENLCMAGGVALNCVSNSYLINNVRRLKNIWIQPAAGDAGGALGAALDVSLKLSQITYGSKTKSDKMNFAQLGPEYSHKDIEAAILKSELIYKDYAKDNDLLCKIVAKELQNKKLIGYFDGRMEFGPRALGNRSILADPRPIDMLQHANNNIKFREAWRPLAPIVLSEYLNDYFENAVDDPYMLFVATLKSRFLTKPSFKDMRKMGFSEIHQFLSEPSSLFPTVTHYDKSARLQSLSVGANPRLHKIMSIFYEETQCPMLLNTSFNVRGEPIICTPYDAINTFLNTNLDVLVIGDFIIERNDQADQISHLIGKRKFNAD